MSRAGAGPSGAAASVEPGRRPLPRLHVVTDDAVLARPDVLEVATAVLEAGGAALALHVRGPHADGATVHRFAAELTPVACAAGALLLVNDRVDVALLVRANGAHLGRRSLPVAAARRLLGAGRRLGVSVHDPGAAAAARKGGADYAFVGTIYDTPSHPEGTVQGVGLVSAVGRAAPGLPLMAIGGVTPPRTAEVLASGAYGVAVLRGVWDADDPRAAVGRYLVEIDSRARHETE